MSQELSYPYSPLNKFEENLKEVFELIKSASPRELKQLLSTKKGLSLESHYYMKYTPLMEAVFLERLDMVEFICKTVKEAHTKNSILSANYQRYINQTSIDGKTAFTLGVLNNKAPSILEFLIKEGARPGIKDREDNDSFHYAQYAITDTVEDYVLSLKKKFAIR